MCGWLGLRAPRCCASSCWPSRTTGSATWWGSPWRATCCAPSSPSPTCRRWTAGCRRSCGWCSAACAGWERTRWSPGTLPNLQADHRAPQRAARSANGERWQRRRPGRSDATRCEETQVVTVQGTSHKWEMLWDYRRKEEIPIFIPRPRFLPLTLLHNATTFDVSCCDCFPNDLKWADYVLDNWLWKDHFIRESQNFIYFKIKRYDALDSNFIYKRLQREGHACQCRRTF